MIKLALITLLSLSYTFNKPNVEDVPGDYLYELRCAGRYHDSVILQSRERGGLFDGYRHKITPGSDFYGKIVKEPSGSVDICYQEIGWQPTFKTFLKGTIFESRLKADASIQGYDYAPPFYGMGGIAFESKGAKLSYKTDLKGHETFTVDTGLKIALALLGKGAWFMPETHYTNVNGENDYRSTLTLGYEWK